MGAAHATENVYEFATEVNVPLLQGLPLVQSLSVDLAGRYTNYSPSGDVLPWKIGADYHVNELHPVPRYRIGGHPRAHPE